MTAYCGRCEESLPTEGDLDFAACCICCKGYHFECTTVGELSWRTMGDSRRGAWKCPNCRDSASNRTSKSDENSITPEVLGDGKETKTRGAMPQTTKQKELPVKQKDQQIKQKEQSSNLNDLAGDNSIVGQLGTKLAALEKTLTLKIEKGFSGSQKDVKELKDKIGEFETALNFYGDKVDQAVVTVKAMEQKMVLMEKKLEKSENENKELKSKLRNMEIQVNGLNQKEFNTKIEISGIKDKTVNKDEVTKKIIDKLENKLGEILYKSEKLTREGEHGKTSIVVEFKSQDTRNLVLTKMKEMRLYSRLDDVFPIDIDIVAH
uniref:PHD-type domain-containing protein n=1 Tax=Cacopsylla melanoneura TaxID=428564 RepID=A0A8D8VW42_9HEMI